MNRAQSDAPTLERAVAGAPGPLLVTGATGFVGGRALERLRHAGLPVHGLARDPELARREPDGGWIHGDLEDRGGLRAAVRALRPAWILHLGALASPRGAAERPAAAWAANVGGTLNLLLAAQDVGARVLLASTAQVYGRRAGTLAEGDELHPGNVYARTKAAAEALVRRFAERGGEGVIARPFNHSGPGQSPEYVLPAFAEALLRAAAHGASVPVGNLEPERDFCHVDDVLDAYGLLLECGVSGAAYNVCRGEGTSIGALLQGLGRRLGLSDEQLEQRIQVDPYRVRNDDPERVVGDGSRLTELGFRVRRSIDDLLDDVAADARRLAARG